MIAPPAGDGSAAARPGIPLPAGSGTLRRDESATTRGGGFFLYEQKETKTRLETKVSKNFLWLQTFGRYFFQPALW